MTQDFELDELAEACLEEPAAAGPPVGLTVQRRYNGCPGQDFVICSRAATGRTLAVKRWGLGAAPAARISPPINARVETVHRKQMFRDSFQQRRCVTPIRGWFEWRRRQPFFIHRCGGAPIFLAGLWDRETFLVLTTAAQPELARIHPRQPAALPKAALGEWLDPATGTDRLLALARCGGDFTARPVSARVGSPRNDAPDLLDPVPAQPELF